MDVSSDFNAALTVPLSANKKNELFEAVARHDKPAVAALIDTYGGAVINGARGQVGMTPLMRAVKSGSSAIMGLLIKEGADVHACDTQGFTAMHYAARQSFAIAIDVLMKHGATVDAPDAKGNTALHLVARPLNAGRSPAQTARKQLDCARLLMKYDAAENTANKAGKTALDTATDNKREDIADCIRRAIVMREVGQIDAGLKNTVTFRKLKLRIDSSRKVS